MRVKKIDLNKVLITGAGGMIGSYIDFGIRTDHDSLDITDVHEVSRVINELRPEAIIHLAAATDLERCKNDPRYAYWVNAIGTYNIATATLEVGAKLVYISTSRIFDGEKMEPYTESDTPNPKDFYSRSKYAGELIVRGMLPDYIIARACWVFGGGREKDVKFVGKVIRQLTVESEIKAVDDIYGSPTFGKDFVSAIKRLLEEDARGIFHLSNEGSCSRYEIAKFVIETLKHPIALVSVNAEQFPYGNSVKNEAMSSERKLMRPWKDALREYLETEWEQKNETL